MMTYLYYRPRKPGDPKPFYTLINGIKTALSVTNFRIELAKLGITKGSQRIKTGWHIADCLFYLPGAFLGVSIPRPKLIRKRS